MPPIYVPVMTAAPVIEGKVHTEAVWATALQVPLGSTGITYFRIGRYTDPGTGKQHVYLGFFANEFQPTMNARVVLAFQTLYNPPPGPTCAWKIHVSPFDLAVPSMVSITPKQIEYWRNPPPPGNPASGWNMPGGSTVVPPTNPTNAWILNNTRAWYFATNMWSMEMKIPVNAAGNYTDAGIWFPPAGTMWRLFVNVLNTPNAGAGGNIQRPWPATTLQMGQISTNTPDVGLWGYASF